MLELVNELQTSRRTKTLVFVSTDGGSDGALGAREFAAHFPQRDLIDGAIVLWQPGSANRRPPALLDTSDGPQSASAGLVRTAERALVDQAGVKPAPVGLFGELAQAGAAQRTGRPGGPDPARASTRWGCRRPASGPCRAAEDQPASLSAATLGTFGRAALLLTATLDAAAEPPGARPGRLRDPVGKPGPGLGARAARADADAACRARVARRTGTGHTPAAADRGWALGWAASRGLPLVTALLLLYLLALIGIVARPRFPFDPGGFGIGAGEVVVMALLAGVVGAGYYGSARHGACRPGWRSTRRARALGTISAVAVLVAWLANPFLALLLVPVAHVWLLDARRRPLPVAGGARRRRRCRSCRSPRPRRHGRKAGPGIRGALAAPSDRRRRPDRVRVDDRPVRAGRMPGRHGGARGPAPRRNPPRRRGRRATPARASTHPLDPRSGSRRSRPSGRISYRANPGG